MKNGKLRIILGLTLIIAQLMALVGFDSAGMHFWDTNKYSLGYEEAGERPTTILFGLYVGYQKYLTAFDHLDEEGSSFGSIAGEESSIQILSTYDSLSAHIRVGLHQKGYDLTLNFYDFMVVAGFFLVGILGFVLLIWGSAASRKFESMLTPRYYTDEDTGALKYIKYCAGVLCGLSLLLRLSMQQSNDGSLLEPGFLLQMLAFLMMTVFFLGYCGRRQSVLVSGAMLCLAGYHLLTTFHAFGAMYLEEWNNISFFQFYVFVTNSACGFGYFVCSIWFYNVGEKQAIRGWCMFGVLANIAFILFYPLVGGVTMADDYFPLVDFGGLLMALVTLVYIWCMPERDYDWEPPVKLINPCPSCGTELGKGKTHCLRCGSSITEKSFSGIPVIGEPVLTSTIRSHAAPPPIGNVCPKCGTEVKAEQAFCGRCGTKLK